MPVPTCPRCGGHLNCVWSGRMWRFPVNPGSTGRWVWGEAYVCQQCGAQVDVSDPRTPDEQPRIAVTVRGGEETPP